MSAIDAGSLGADARAQQARRGAELTRRGAAKLLDWMVALWIFAGGFVFFDPSPYEISFLLLLPVALVGGFGLHRSTIGLLWIFVLFIPFALIGAFQVKIEPLDNAVIFVFVTIFLLFTSYFVANYVAEAPEPRMRLIIAAYTVTAVISALIGTLAYFGIIPGAELFTRYDRAKAFFQDPNVYGPFLILPAMFALQRLFLGSGWRILGSGVILLILTVGVFASFSRAAWGHLAVSGALVFLLCFLLEAGLRQKVRMLLLTVAGALVLVVALGGLLSIPSVQKLFEIRTQSQDYDSGETGRFGRQGFAFELALEHPFGIGPLEFRHLRVIEEPHNTYVNVLHVYGWGGGLAYYAFFLLTLFRGVAGLARPSPHRLLLIPLMATFVPLAAESAIIDTDHWRHYFLIAGLIWGVTAAMDRRSPRPPAPSHASANLAVSRAKPAA